MEKTKTKFLALLLFLAFFFILDRGIYYVCSQAYQNIPRTESGGMVPDALRHKADVVILGSSLARHHYVPAILEEKLGVSVYNLGADGQGLAFVRCAVDILLHHYRPQVFIFDISSTMLSVQAQALTAPRVTVLASYLDESAIVRKTIFGKGYFEKFKYVSKAYRFNGLPVHYIYNFLFPCKEVAGQKGFLPLTQTHSVRAETKKSDSWLLDHTAPKLLRAAIVQAKKMGVQVIIVQSPHGFLKNTPESSLHTLYIALKQLAESELVPFIEITHQTHDQLKDPGLYADAAHLNHEGAKIFSSILAKQLLFEQPTTNH